MKTIEVKGDIISNEQTEMYDWLGLSYTSPSMINNIIEDANGEDIEVKVNSPGGDVFSASEIYTELKEYKGNVTIKIQGIAASAASIISMAGDKVLISPTAQIMIHNVMTGVAGDYRAMDHMSEVLKSANDAISNAYVLKTGKSKEEILELMNNETYIDAKKAKELGFVDEIMFEDEKKVNFDAFVNSSKHSFYNSVDKHQFIEKLKFQNKVEDRNVHVEKDKNNKSVEPLKKIKNEVYYMFKNKEDFLKQKEELINKAQKLYDEGSYEESISVSGEVKELENKFNKFAEAQANLNVLKENNTMAKINNIEVKEAGVLASMGNNAENNFYNSIEYRKSFMNYVTTGKKDAVLLNSHQNTKVADVGAVIPETIMSKIIEKMESIGNILPLVTRTSYKGGVSVPTSTVKPVATWVAEGAGSDKQKKTTGSITFGAYKLRCAVSTSLEVAVESLEFFERALVKNVSDAMVKALEQAIVKGTGSGQPKGFLTESAPAGQNIDVAKSTALAYKHLAEAEAALPLAYESSAVWFMTKKSFMAFIGMVDSQGQPIARVNYGVAGKPERSLMGRKVILNDYMDNYEATPSGTKIFAALFDPSDYIVNTNYGITIKKYEDNETDDIVTKAIMLVDGKAVDVNSLVTLTKKNA